MKATNENEIYKEYINSDLSYKKIAKKYNVSPEVVSRIVKEHKEAISKSKITSSTPKNTVYKYRDLAIEQLAQNNPKKALQMFESLLIWYESNKEYRGLADLYGHLARCYQSLSKSSKNKSDKLNNYSLAEVYLNKAVKLSEEGTTPKGSICVTKAHLAKNKLLKSEFLKNNNKEKELKDSLELIESIIPTFPGSEAHKSWPTNIKTQILIALNELDQAYQTAQEAENYIYKGYDKEMNWKKYRKAGSKGHIGNDQAGMKLDIWLSTTHLNQAYICKLKNYNRMAKHYATSVLNLPDDNRTLKASKNKAKMILDSI